MREMMKIQIKTIVGRGVRSVGDGLLTFVARALVAMACAFSGRAHADEDSVEVEFVFKMIDENTNGVAGVKVFGVPTDADGIAKCRIVLTRDQQRSFEFDHPGFYGPRPYSFGGWCGSSADVSRRQVDSPTMIRRKVKPHPMDRQDIELRWWRKPGEGGHPIASGDLGFFTYEAGLFNGAEWRKRPGTWFNSCSTERDGLSAAFLELTPKNAETGFVRVPEYEDLLRVPIEAPEEGYDLKKLDFLMEYDRCRSSLTTRATYAFRAKVDDGFVYGVVMLKLYYDTFRMRILQNRVPGVRSLETDTPDWF